MSEHDTSSPEPALPERPSEPAATARRSWRTTFLVTAGVIVAVLLAGGETFLFRAQSGMPNQTRRIATLESQVNALQSKVTSFDRRLAELAARPQPKAAPPKAIAENQIPAALDTRLAAMQAGLAALSTTTVADHAAVVTLQSNAASLPKLVAKAQTLARIAQASLALQNGDALGPIPNAPEALVRYANAKPPTLGALKSSFPAYARKAVRAGGSVAADGGFWQKLRFRVESLVTVRHGGKVLVGSRAQGILAAAQRDLGNDDLAAALASLKTLPPGAQSAMTPWTRQATHLLAARAALADMADHS
ncbi:COG4223 family protein [Acidiphilium iwatense]|uniref:Uncharacterized protein n=1 Tax=Acidiphilium iwatense TaxID=768198 RepID=A0ABS9DRK3_9PROT|nr:hypothetical protein [Acidiphilium iwatense]MCF3945383.1 hypothetical protein [Acidiphilium iwatense]